MLGRQQPVDMWALGITLRMSLKLPLVEIFWTWKAIQILMDFQLMYSPVRNLTKPTSIPALQRTLVLSIGGWGRLDTQIGVVGKQVVSMGRVSILAIPSGIRFPS